MTVILGIAITTLVLGLFLKEQNRTISLLLVIFSCIALAFQSVGAIAEIIKSLNDMASQLSETSAYIKIMFKVLGIALIAQLVSDLCRDCGESALAGQTETAAKILIITMIIPLLEAVISIISGLLL
ncbi:MAG: SpoIIIAC/SpoIIIAD family protein [Eubacterium sp.]|uniref:SpoIIIAC/SpoIIIAD family protein n=1 Tax=Eubacterium sp. TaxID=142586 RepID=UPI003A13E772